MSVFYLSFAEPRPPKGRGWLGGIYVEADDFMAAVKRSIELDQNPGGQVVGALCSKPIDAKFLNRLLTKHELRASDPEQRLANQRGEEV